MRVGSFGLMIGIINLISILIIFVLKLHIYRKITDVENDIRTLNEYRKNNEIQLENLINDINKNDEYLADKVL
jgi:hypothetical protein|tara:strand:- start:1480 stop:1698 length:219 start_codon:yes stop_codon:yes gene_type:complete